MRTSSFGWFGSWEAVSSRDSFIMKMLLTPDCMLMLRLAN